MKGGRPKVTKGTDFYLGSVERREKDGDSGCFYIGVGGGRFYRTKVWFQERENT